MNAKKRLLSLALTFIMIFVSSISVFATEPSNIAQTETSAKANQQPLLNFAVGHSGKITDHFTVLKTWGTATLKVNLKVSSPTVGIFRIKDSNGKILGTASYNVTRTDQSFTFGTNPASLGTGTYYYEFEVLDPVNYNFYLYAYY